MRSEPAFTPLASLAPAAYPISGALRNPWPDRQRRPSSLARDHPAPESTLALVKAASLAYGRSRPLAWCSRPRKRATSPARPHRVIRIAADGDPWREEVPELHRRRVGRRSLRRDLRVDEPGKRRDDRRLPEVRAGGRRPRRRRSQGGLRRVAARPGAEARRSALPLRAATRRAQGRR